MWGIIPAAGAGSRIQPLAFSKELLPTGSRFEGGTERPRAVSEYLVERMLVAGADKLCFVIAPGKSDILTYYGGQIGQTPIVYVVQQQPAGLCDALFRALPVVHPDERLLIGLPDTIWFPVNGFTALPDHELAFLLFQVARPELFDAVLTDNTGRVTEIQVKQATARTPWIWGGFKMPGNVFHQLHELWRGRDRRDEYLGTLVNAWLALGGTARGVFAGETYADVGTLHGYREAVNLLNNRNHETPSIHTPHGALPTRAA